MVNSIFLSRFLCIKIAGIYVIYFRATTFRMVPPLHICNFWDITAVGICIFVCKYNRRGTYSTHFLSSIYYICMYVHSDLVIFGHWVLKIHKNFRKLRKRKFRGYCYVVIGTNDCKNPEKFKKPKIVRLVVCNDWVYAHGHKSLHIAVHMGLKD